MIIFTLSILNSFKEEFNNDELNIINENRNLWSKNEIWSSKEIIIAIENRNEIKKNNFDNSLNNIRNYFITKVFNWIKKIQVFWNIIKKQIEWFFGNKIFSNDSDEIYYGIIFGIFFLFIFGREDYQEYLEACENYY